LTALLVLCGLASAGAVRAETVLIHNATPAPLVVQSAVLVRGVPRNDRQFLLKPGESGVCSMQSGTKVVTLYDPRNTNRPLFQGPIPASDTNQEYVILPDGPNRIRVEPKR
jgi:hypothetical protein